MTDLKLQVDEEANNSLEPIANRKMTCDTVLGSMGGNDASSNGQQSQQHAYDGGSLSTIEDDSPPSHRYKRKVAMMPGFCYSYFGKIAKSCTKLLPVHCSNTEQSTSSTARSVYNLIPTTTAFRALMRRNMIYRKRNWLSGVSLNTNNSAYRDFLFFLTLTPSLIQTSSSNVRNSFLKCFYRHYF